MPPTKKASSVKGLEERMGLFSSASTPPVYNEPEVQEPEGTEEIVTNDSSIPIVTPTLSSQTIPVAALPPEKSLSSRSVSEEIYFIADELTEEVNKAVETVLYNLHHPLAEKQLSVLFTFVRHLILAQAHQMHERNPLARRLLAIPPPQVRVQKTFHSLQPRAITRPWKTLSSEHQIIPQSPVSEEYLPSVDTALKPRNQPDVPVLHVPLVYDQQKTALVGADIQGTTYTVVEPPLPPTLNSLLDLARKHIEPVLAQSDRGLYKALFDLARQHKIKLDDQSYNVLHYYLDRDFLRLGKITALFLDKKISQIICEEPQEPIVVIRDSERLVSNLLFESTEELNALLRHIATKTFQTLDFDNPVVDVTYGDFRIQGTLGTDMVPARFIATRLVQ